MKIKELCELKENEMSGAAKKVIEYLDDHPGEAYRTTELAELTGYSPDHFRNALKRYPAVAKYFRHIRQSGHNRVWWASPFTWAQYDKQLQKAK